MKNAISTRRPGLLSIAEAAWLLGVDNSCVCRAIRVGLLPVVRRRDRVFVPAHTLAYLADDDRTAEPSARAVRRGGA